MISLIHRGWGGRYTNYISQNVKNINRMRRMELTSQIPFGHEYKIAVCSSGTALTDAKMNSILSHPRVSFYIGDSKGIPENILNEMDEIVSVSSLNICHQLEAAILTASIEQHLINSNIPVCV